MIVPIHQKTIKLFQYFKNLSVQLVEAGVKPLTLGNGGKCSTIMLSPLPNKDFTIISIVTFGVTTFSTTTLTITTFGVTTLSIQGLFVSRSMTTFGVTTLSINGT
jgi:hypothetical protein